MKKGDELKAAFWTNWGLFKPLVMFFGLTNSLATFQTMMDGIFEELITEGQVVVYLDDILIFTDTLEEHQKITWEVLCLLWKHNLYLKPEKCEFKKTEVEYFGVVISHNSMRMDPACPLSDLTKADTKWKWGLKEQSTFDVLKGKVTSALILILPDNLKLFWLFHQGRSSQQSPDDEKWHPIAFLSK